MIVCVGSKCKTVTMNFMNSIQSTESAFALSNLALIITRLTLIPANASAIPTHLVQRASSGIKNFVNA